MGGGDRVSRSPWKITKYVSKEISVWSPLEKQLDPFSVMFISLKLGLIASRGRSVQPSVKYVDD